MILEVICSYDKHNKKVYIEYAYSIIPCFNFDFCRCDANWIHVEL